MIISPLILNNAFLKVFTVSYLMTLPKLSWIPALLLANPSLNVQCPGENEGVGAMKGFWL